MSALEELFGLKGKVAVVLGGTSGIGHAIALGLAKAGATVVASSRNQEKVDQTAKELEALGSQTLRLTSDVQDRDSLVQLRDEVIRAFGKVDVLVVTAGALKKVPTLELSEEDWQRLIDINLSGTYRANQIFGQHMIERRSGSIINTGSLTSFVSFHEVAGYAAGKGGVKMLTQSLACEWAPYNVRVNAIIPGVILTPLNQKVLEIPERRAAILARTPMGRIGQPEDLVGAAIYLASDASSFVTGTCLVVDGGFLAKGI